MTTEIETTQQIDTRVFYTRVCYVKLIENGDTAIYLFPLFDKVVYVRVRVKERLPNSNIVMWLNEPKVEKIGLSLAEVNGNGE